MFILAMNDEQGITESDFATNRHALRPDRHGSDRLKRRQAGSFAINLKPDGHIRRRR